MTAHSSRARSLSKAHHSALHIACKMRGKLAPQGCPVGKTSIPRMLHTRLIEWAHTSPASGHPGVARTYSVLSCRYWWPKMFEQCGLCQGLSQSQSYMAIMIPFVSLPSTMQVAEALLQHVFHYDGITEEILSSHGPQFVSKVWCTFFKRLEVAINLFSGYHPETNGQAKRSIQELGRILLRAYCSSQQRELARYLVTPKTPCGERI